MKRGVIFSIDLLIGVVIALSFTALLIYRSDITEPLMEKNTILSLKAGDALNVMDRMGIFSTANKTVIENTLEDMFVSEDYEIEIRYYDENFTSFNLIKIGNITENFVSIKRVIEFRNVTPVYGIVILKVRN